MIGDHLVGSLLDPLLAIFGIVLGFGDDILSMLTASEITPKKVEWLWHNRIPLGKLTLFVGDPDNGKSMVATHVASTVSTGRDWYDVKNALAPGEVLIFASEDDHDDTTVPRLMAADANLSKIYFGRMCVGELGETSTARDMRLDKDIETIKKALVLNPNIRLVVIDPVSNHLGDTKMTDEQAVRRALTPLQQLAAERSVAIVGIMHLNKKADLQAINRIGGAMAFVGLARAVWLFSADKEKADEFHMLPIKKNIGKRQGGLTYRIDTKPVDIEGEAVQQPCITWIGNSNQSPDAALASRRLGRPREEREKALQWLRELLRDGPVPSKQIEAQCKAAGFSYRTLERIKGEPDSIVKAFREDEKWNWKLSD